MGLVHVPKNKKKVVDIAFLAYEAVMHFYLFFFLINHHANIIVLCFATLELIMYFRLLINNKRELKQVPCSWHEACCQDQNGH